MSQINCNCEMCGLYIVHATSKDELVLYMAKIFNTLLHLFF